MSRTVFCTKYQKQLKGLAIPPLPGTAGQAIFETISSQAWQEWMQLQTMLINEKQLNMMDIGARTYLSEQRTKFFNNEDYEQAEGYVPPSE
jgi:Fe-S cluster biosynthesis and repair protein YggX